jgi:hypothetical protein
VVKCVVNVVNLMVVFGRLKFATFCKFIFSECAPILYLRRLPFEIASPPAC